MIALHYTFFISMIVFFLIYLKIMFGINIEKIFKQGKVWEIGFFTILVSFILSALTSFGLVAFVYSILKVVQFF